jgi:integrase
MVNVLVSIESRRPRYQQMAKITLPGKLSAVKVKQAKPTSKTFKLADGHGLYLEIRPNGSKYWRLAYRFHKKQKTLALGVYPVVTLEMAREKVLNAKRLLDECIDPSVYKKQQKAALGQRTFEVISKEWFDKQSGGWSEGHAAKVWQSIKSGAFPYLRNFQITEIKASDVLHVIRKIEERGALDVAARVKQRISAIFRYAIQVGYAEHNPVDALKDVLQSKRVEHRKSIKRDEISEFLEALDDYRGYPITRLALNFIVFTFVRPGELRSAEWVDFDLENQMWRIPAEKMKMKEEHLVPLSSQALAILEEVKEHTGNYDLVFPSTHDRRKAMSENTLTYAIRKRLRFDATAHGFRTTASTTLNEAGFRVDVIERQLAHCERNKVRNAYNRAQYLDERIEMMQWYGQYLAAVGSKENVIPLLKTS